MMPVASRPMNRTEWALLVALSILWGGSFFFVAVAVKEIPPLTVVLGRVTLGALALIAVLRIAGIAMPRTREAWTAFFGMAILNNVVPFSLMTWGQSHIASGLASILNATTPLFTVIVLHLFTQDEKATVPKTFGVLVGFAGVAAMMGGAALGTSGIEIAAQAAVLLGALSYGFSGLFGRRFMRMGIAPLATAAGQATASSLLLAPIALLVDQPWTLPAPSLAAIGAVLGLALASTALAYIIFFRILATAGATNLMLVTFLIPVTAILLGILVLGESLAPRHLVGMAMIGVGLAAIDGRILAVARRALIRESA